MNQILTIPDGFGLRLRQERERLGLNQTELASIGGVKRLAQSQYEKELSSPTVKYLAAVSAVGVDVQYALWGARPDMATLPLVEQSQIEIGAFEMLADYLRQQPEVNFGAQGWFALFQLFRNNLLQESLQNQSLTLTAK